MFPVFLITMHKHKSVFTDNGTSNQQPVISDLDYNKRSYHISFIDSSSTIYCLINLFAYTGEIIDLRTFLSLHPVFSVSSLVTLSTLNVLVLTGIGSNRMLHFGSKLMNQYCVGFLK